MRNTEINTEPGDGWSDGIYHVSGQVEHLEGHENFQVIDMAPRQECLHVGPRSLLQKYVSNIEHLVCNGLCLWL